MRQVNNFILNEDRINNWLFLLPGSSPALHGRNYEHLFFTQLSDGPVIDNI